MARYRPSAYLLEPEEVDAETKLGGFALELLRDPTVLLPEGAERARRCRSSGAQRCGER